MKTAYSENMQKLFKIFHRYKYLLIVVAAGLVLILWPKGGSEQPEQSADEYQAFSVTELEKRLEKALAQIDGAGKVEVVLTLKSDMELVLQQDSKTRQYREMEDGSVTVQESEGEYSTVLSGGSSSGSPVVTKRIYPQFQGALVVCEGAKNPAVQMAVLEAVGSLTGLRSNEITIAAMKK